MLVLAGYLAKTDKVLIQPLNELCSIKAIKYQNDNVDYAFSGRNVDIGLNDVQLNMLSVGCILCDPMVSHLTVTSLHIQPLPVLSISLPSSMWPYSVLPLAVLPLIREAGGGL